MNLTQILVERLRPFVGLKGWDYCVFWKLSEDQRFLEFIYCCCGGAENVQSAGEELLFPASSVPACRDVMFQHLRTKPCELLAQLPSSIPLDLGIHGQALISIQPRWLNFCNNSNPSASEDTVGTRVLIPVSLGLIELFVTRQVSEDQNLVDFILFQCNNLLDQQAMISSNNADSIFSVNVNEINMKPFHNDGSDQTDPDIVLQPPVSPATAAESLNLSYDISVDRIRLSGSPMNFLQQFTCTENRTKNNILFEGTSEPFCSVENGFPEVDPINSSVTNNAGNIHMHNMDPSASKEQEGNDKDSIKQETGRSDSISDSDPNDDEEDTKYRRRNGKGPQSKNLVAERKRRKKLNDRLYALRALVPKISKLDRASILGDAIEFVKELQKQVGDLQSELEDHSDDEGARDSGITNNNPGNSVHPEIMHGISVPIPEHEKHFNGSHMGASNINGTDLPMRNQESENTNDKVQQMEPQVEVGQLDGNGFYVKVFCEHKPGGFVRLMEALNSLGLEVTNVNVTSFRCLVSNVFTVEIKNSGMVQADHVRNSLLELTRNPSSMTTVSENGNGENHHQCPHHHHHPRLHSRQINAYNHHHHHHLHHLNY